MEQSASPTGRDLAGYGRDGTRVEWPGGARVAVCVIVNYEEGSERSYASGDGANEPPQEFGYPELGIRDFGNETLFEYGSRAGIWRLARLFDSLSIPVTLQACAQAIELNPDVGAWVLERGHEVCCHGYRWENVSVLDRETEWEHLQRAVQSIEATCGARPVGWYSRQPPSVNTRVLLVRDGGFLYDSDSFADDLPYYVQVSGRDHLVIPYSFTLNDGRFMPAQSYSDPTSFVDYCTRHFDYLWEEGARSPKMMSIGVHARFTGQPSRAHALREFLQYAQDKSGAWFTTRVELAHWWIDHGFGRPAPTPEEARPPQHLAQPI